MTERAPRPWHQSTQRYLNPPRYRGAEDISGRERAERRGGITEEEFLTTMLRAGFRVVDPDVSPFFTFTHPVLGDTTITGKHAETFSRMADRAIAMVAEMQIVKVQKPLAASTRDDLWLIYPRGRRWRVLMPGTSVPDHVRAVVDATYKAFFYGRRIGDGNVMQFGGQAPDQTW
jgi:hypothetical protein